MTTLLIFLALKEAGVNTPRWFFYLAVLDTSIDVINATLVLISKLT